VGYLTLRKILPHHVIDLGKISSITNKILVQILAINQKMTIILVVTTIIGGVL
jgi:hypothetical protein